MIIIRSTSIIYIYTYIGNGGELNNYYEKSCTNFSIKYMFIP